MPGYNTGDLLERNGKKLIFPGSGYSEEIVSDGADNEVQYNRSDENRQNFFSIFFADYQ